MGNLANSLKRFLSNKNTVTLLGVIVGVIVLYVGYTWRVNQATAPVTIPYAKQEITSRTLITSDMVGTMSVPKTMVNNSNNIVRDSSSVVGKYVKYGVIIPINSLFYNELLTTEDAMPDSAFADIPDGYTIYSLSVNLHTTYGNSIFPGNYIDLYVRATDTDNKIIFGRFIESIEVLAVKDAAGRHVFESATETRTPSELLFAVPNDMYSLLMKAGYVPRGNIQIIPVPRNSSYSANPGETLVSSDYIQEFILEQSVMLPDNEESPETNTDTVTNDNSNNNNNTDNQ